MYPILYDIAILLKITDLFKTQSSAVRSNLSMMTKTSYLLDYILLEMMKYHCWRPFQGLTMSR